MLLQLTGETVFFDFFFCPFPIVTHQNALSEKGGVQFSLNTVGILKQQKSILFGEMKGKPNTPVNVICLFKNFYLLASLAVFAS